MTESVQVCLDINGRSRKAHIDPRTSLLKVLREVFGLTGAKLGCNQGVCGACNVLVDGRPVRACLTLAIASTRSKITTIEGLSAGRELSVLQESFARSAAVQCGFCTSGMIVAAHALLTENPHPTRQDIRNALAGNLCRCTGYVKIIEAVERAAGRE